MTNPDKNGDGPLVLVVEDDDDLREVIELFLDSIGLSHASAANGLEALASVAKRKPSVILLDMRMPVMDGEAFAHELHARLGHEIPIILMTAAEEVEASARLIAAEENAAKPFDIHAMELILRRVLKAPLAESRA